MCALGERDNPISHVQRGDIFTRPDLYASPSGARMELEFLADSFILLFLLPTRKRERGKDEFCFSLLSLLSLCTGKFISRFAFPGGPRKTADRENSESLLKGSCVCG